MRHAPLLVLLIAASSACGRKTPDGAKAIDENEGRDQPRACALPATGVVDKDVTITRGCMTVVERSLVVKNGAKLVLEPGTTLAFEPGTGLRVEKGALVARGAPDAKILFTSHAPTRAAGDWVGITLADDGATTPSILAHVAIEWAGGKNPAASPVAAASASAKTYGILGSGGIAPVQLPTQAALVLDDAARNVALEQVSFGHHASVALLVRKPDGLARCEACSTVDTGAASMFVPSETLAVFTASSFDAPVHVFGDVTRKTTWPTLTVPIHVDETIAIDSGLAKAPAVLDVGDGNTLKLARFGKLIVGGAAKGGSGALVARRAHFTWMGTSRWGSIELNNAPAGTVLDSCTFDHGGDTILAGLGSAPFAVVMLPTIDRGITIAKNRFVDNDAPAMAGEKDCHGHDRPSFGNTSKGQDLCWKDPFAEMLLGTLGSASSVGVFAGADDTGSMIMGPGGDLGAMGGGTGGGGFGSGSGAGVTGIGQGGGGWGIGKIGGAGGATGVGPSSTGKTAGPPPAVGSAKP